MGERGSRSDDSDLDSQPDESINDSGDLEAELQQRDTAITELQESLSTERKISNSLRQNIKKLDDRIGNLGDGLIDRLGTCRDLQSVLAEEKARSKTVEGELADRNERLDGLRAEAEERSQALREYQQQLDELTGKRNALQARLAESANNRIESNVSSYGGARRNSEPDPALCSLEELMAETTVLTEEDVQIEAQKLIVEEQSPEIAEVLADMVAPEQMLPNAVAEKPHDKKSSAAAHRLGTLIVSLQGRHQVKYPLYPGEMTIGRSKENDIQVNSEFVSRVHARIVTTVSGVVIEDVSSKNGVVVGSNTVERHEFEDGDTATLGTTHITYFTLSDAET